MKKMMILIMIMMIKNNMKMKNRIHKNNQKKTVIKLMEIQIIRRKEK